MKVFHSINDFIPATLGNKKTIITLGTFDGVHLGHQEILKKVTQNTLNGQYESLVLTFFPHPRMVLQNQNDIKLLNTIEEKKSLLKSIGIENLVIHPFDQTFSQLDAEAFVKTILVERFNIHKIIIGHDHRFGKDRTANIDDLTKFGKIYNFEVEQISAQEIESISISSTKIRKALNTGKMGLANNYLGYPYFIKGMVITGKQLGRTIDFPTANLQIIENYKLIPLQGVYIVQSIINQRKVFGMMNIGINPTVSGNDPSVEIHFFDFNTNLYGSYLEVSILEYIRAEIKFESINLLKEQLKKDALKAKAYISKLIETK